MFPRIDGLRTLELGPPGELRARLNELVLRGEKQATFGLKELDYERENEAIEHVGERLVLVDDDVNPLATIEVTEVIECSFGEVTWEMAEREREGDQDLNEWREGHRNYWKRVEGIDVTDDTPVVFVAFRLTPKAIQKENQENG